MKNLQKTADSIYAYCVMAMDYDMMGLIFSESALLSALRDKKHDIKELSEEEFITLKELLRHKVSDLYERNRAIVTQDVSEDDVVKKMTQDDAQSEMVQAETFIKYLNNELNYNDLKTIVG